MDSFDRGVSCWVDIAEYDLETAEAMLTTKRYLYVGFMIRKTKELSQWIKTQL